MKRNYYILKDGILKRKENTVYFVNKEGKKILPINKINSIYAYGNLSFTSAVTTYLSKKGVCIHFYDKYGFYVGTLYPRKTLLSGNLIIQQAKHYLEKDLRIYLAKKFVEGSCKNIIKNVKNYKLLGYSEKMENLLNELDNRHDIFEIMEIEGKIREFYYKAFDEIFPDPWKMGKRERRPPSNMTNCLISFGNSLLYSTIISEIYKTQLNATISYLHEPGERRFSLALDIADVFKPIIVDRIIFKLVNKGMINDHHFRKDLGGILLNDEGKRLFIEEYDKRMVATIFHRGLGRKVSYQQLIRLELYKLIKHFVGLKKYQPFVSRW